MQDLVLANIWQNIYKLANIWQNMYIIGGGGRSSTATCFEGILRAFWSEISFFTELYLGQLKLRHNF